MKPILKIDLGGSKGGEMKTQPFAPASETQVSPSIHLNF